MNLKHEMFWNAFKLIIFTLLNTMNLKHEMFWNLNAKVFVNQTYLWTLNMKCFEIQKTVQKTF